MCFNVATNNKNLPSNKLSDIFSDMFINNFLESR